jgi:hypothetical protein
MLELGQCIIELFSRTPSSLAGFRCAGKHLSEHDILCNQARRNREPVPPRPRLWMISPGRPRSLMANMLMQPMEAWPTGFWHVGGAYNVHLIVVRDLPASPDTLLLRLLDHGKRREQALAELDALPRSWLLRQRLVHVGLAWKTLMGESFETTPMISPKAKAAYDRWENKVLAQGRKEGIEQGLEKGLEQGLEQGLEKGLEQGIAQGKRALVRKLLMLRFGTLTANAERRIEHASLAELELWAERVLTANSLPAVFTD